MKGQRLFLRHPNLQSAEVTDYEWLNITSLILLLITIDHFSRLWVGCGFGVTKNVWIKFSFLINYDLIK